MVAKKKSEIVCTVEMTEGAEQRITEALVDLYYDIKNGKYSGPLLLKTQKEEPA